METFLDLFPFSRVAYKEDIQSGKFDNTRIQALTNSITAVYLPIEIRGGGSYFVAFTL